VVVDSRLKAVGHVTLQGIMSTMVTASAHSLKAVS